MKRVKTMPALSYRPVKKLFPLLLTLMFFCCNINTYAQNEPNCNIGKSLTQMKKDFPELRFTKTDTKGDQYMDGYPQDGIGVFFYMKDDIVIEECMIVQSNDGFPRMWYDKMVDSFVSNYPPGFGTSGYNANHWCYSTFSVHLIYVSENNINTAMIIYEAGGWKTGVTGAKFFEKYKQ